MNDRIKVSQAGAAALRAAPEGSSKRHSKPTAGRGATQGRPAGAHRRHPTQATSRGHSRADKNQTPSHVAAQLVMKFFDFPITYRYEDFALVDARGQRISDVSFSPQDGPSIAAELNAVSEWCR